MVELQKLSCSYRADLSANNSNFNSVLKDPLKSSNELLLEVFQYHILHLKCNYAIFVQYYSF